MAGIFKSFVRAGRDEDEIMAAMRKQQRAAFGKPTNRAPKAERSTDYTPPSTDTSTQTGSSRPKAGSKRSRSHAKPAPKPRELEAGTGRTARQTRGAVEAGTGRHARQDNESKSAPTPRAKPKNNAAALGREMGRRATKEGNKSSTTPTPRARPKAPRLSGLVVSAGFDERKRPRPKPSNAPTPRKRPERRTASVTPGVSSSYTRLRNSRGARAASESAPTPRAKPRRESVLPQAKPSGSHGFDFELQERMARKRRRRM